MMGQLILSLLVLAPVLSSADDTSATRHLLVNPSQLLDPSASNEQLADNTTYIDVRSSEAYEQGHLPGARHVDAAAWKAAFGDGTDGLEWGRRIARVLGDARGTVIVYDHATTPTAARIWWILKYWGVEDVRLLDGGYQAWQAAGGEPSKTLPAAMAPGNFKAIAHRQRLATYADVLSASQQQGSDVCLVDARTIEENNAGEIPTAEHLDWQRLIDEETGKLRPFGEVRSKLREIGFDDSSDTPTITYCQSGGRAALMAFALELVGGEPAANYYGSWGEWSKKTGVQIEASATGSSRLENGP